MQAKDHGSIWLVIPENDEEQSWLRNTAPEDAQWVGHGMVVEPRYIMGVFEAWEKDNDNS